MEISKTIVYLCLFVLVISAAGKPDMGKTILQNGALESDDVPRVKIKVFRGPMEEQDGEQFTKWGFWIKQPVNIK